MINDFQPYTHLPDEEGNRHYYKNPLTNQPGCYLVNHIPSGNVYVGSSVNLAGRITGNLNHLKNNKHKNKNLQAFYNNDPTIKVSFKTTQTEEEARNLEQTMVNTLLPTGKLLNIAIEDVTKTSLGLKRSVEIREKMSESQTGRKFTNEAKKNMSDAQKRYLSTPEGQARFSNIINKISKTVTIDGNTYSSISEASRILGIPHRSLVRKYNL